MINGNTKIVAIITLVFSAIFTILCLGLVDVSLKTLIGVGFFALYFLIITVTSETDDVIKKEIGELTKRMDKNTI